MANLSVYVSSSVNGVAQIHSELLKRDSSPGLVRLLSGAVPEQDQYITPSPLAGAEQSGADGVHPVGDWRWVPDRPGPAGGAEGQDDDLFLVTRFNRVKLVKKQQLCDQI